MFNHLFFEGGAAAVLVLFCFQARVSLCNGLSCSETSFVDQAGLEHLNLQDSGSASQVLGLKMWTPSPGLPEGGGCWWWWLLVLVMMVCSPDFSGTHYADGAGLKLRETPLGSKVCTTMIRLSELEASLVYTLSSSPASTT